MYKVGDLVLVDSRQRRKGINSKLQPQFVGPFRISKAYCNHTYRLYGDQSLVSQSRLKLYHDSVVDNPYHDSVVDNPVCVPTVTFSSPARAEKQTELSDHGGDNLQNNPSTIIQAGIPIDEHDKKDKGDK